MSGFIADAVYFKRYIFAVIDYCEMKKLPVLLTARYIINLVVAFIAGPYSCEWGNTVYTIMGLVVIVITVALPFFQREWAMNKRVGFAFLFLLISLIVWIAGFAMGGFRILCKLF